MSSKDDEDPQVNSEPTEESGKADASLEDISNDENSQISEGSFICNDDEEYEKVSEESDDGDEIQSPSETEDSPKSPEPEPFKPEQFVKVRSGHDTVRTVDALDGELDFEADDKEEMEEKHKKSKNGKFEVDLKDEVEEVSEEEEDDLEEGEVKEDEDDGDGRRPKTPPQSVCRFYSQGHCTWGPSCRFYHPPSADSKTPTSNKGNYSMFEPPKPLVPPPPRDYTAIPAARTLLESAWERSLQTAKELVKAASKRKEQSPEFEEKCLNQTLSNNDLLPPYEPTKSSYLKTFDNRDYWPDPHGTYDPKKERREVRSRKERSRDKRQSTTPERYANFRQYKTKDDARRLAADEWHDPWRRSKSPKGKRSSSQDSNDSASSSKSFSSRSSSYSESSAVSSRSHSGSRTPPPDNSTIKPARAPVSRKAFSKSKSRSSVSCTSSYSSSGSEDNSPSRSPSRESAGRPLSPPAEDDALEDTPILDGEEAHLAHVPPSKKIKLTLLYDKNANGLARDSNGDSKKTKAKSNRVVSRKRSAQSDDSSSGHGGSSRREELLKQLKAVEDAIARKRSRN